MKELLIKSRNILVLRSVLSILFGISIFVFPVGAALTFALVAGIAVIAFGSFASIASFTVRCDSPDWWVLLVEGLLSLLLGIMIVAWPLSALFVIILSIAFWMMFIGLMTIFEAIKLRKEIEGEGWYIFSGIFAFITGLLMLILPLQAGGYVLYLIASMTIVYGLIMLVVVFKLNKVKRQMDQLK